MKKTILLAVTLVTIFTSCQKEQVDQSGTTVTTGGGGFGGGGNNTEACKDCLYLPTCEGSVYKYRDTVSNGPNTIPTISETISTVKYLGDSSIGGLTYRKIRYATTGNEPVSFTNCNNGVITNIAYNVVSNGGTNLSEIKLILLKSNEPVGATWTDNIILNPQQSASYDNTIVAKGVNKTVSGIVYPNVIEVKTVFSAVYAGIVIPSGYTLNYFAKGVGLIESVSYNDLTGTSIQISRRVLVSAQIP
jgi:hypothetical protein